MKKIINVKETVNTTTKTIKQHIVNSKGNAVCGIKSFNEVNVSFFDDGKLYNSDFEIVTIKNYKDICLNCLRKAMPKALAEWQLKEQELIKKEQDKLRLKVYKESIPKQGYARKRINSHYRRVRQWEFFNRKKERGYGVIELPYVRYDGTEINNLPSTILNTDLIALKPKAIKKPILRIVGNNTYQFNILPDYLLISPDNRFFQFVEKQVDKNNKVILKSVSDWLTIDQAEQMAVELAK